jgi:UDP-2,3-diacylglucosamine hydrolase
MDVNEAAAVACLREHGATHLVHGHTHRPAVHALEVDGRPARRTVLGDWYESGIIGCAGPDGLRLVEAVDLLAEG